MKITRRQLKSIIREAIEATNDEIQKIEELYWISSGGEYHQRDQAVAMIDVFGLDPKTLRVWDAVYPWGEVYEPWEAHDVDHTWGINGWVANPDEPGFTIEEIENIVNAFNSQNEIQLTTSISQGERIVQMDTKATLDQDVVESIFDGVEIAANGVMNS